MAPTTLTGERLDFLHATTGLRSWLLTRDHKRVALMYLAGLLIVFLAAGLLGLVLRAELATPAVDLLAAPDATGEAAAAFGRDLYNKLFTVHGALMLFAFAIPAIPAVLGNFLLPLMLGAHDVAFPRLNLAAFYLWVAGAVLLAAAILGGQLDTGVTFNAPYATRGEAPILLANVGLLSLGAASLLTGLNFLVTIHKLRAPGVTWSRLPLFAWSLYATAVVQLLATPVLLVTLVLLLVENTLHIGVFDPTLGGDPVLFQHFFWFYGHPASILVLLPALGVVSELFGVHAKRSVYGYRGLAMALVALALLAFVGWGQHLVVSGQSPVASAIFSLFTLLAAVPVLVHVIAWVATLRGGAVTLRAPMLYALMFAFTATVGALAGVFMAALTPNAHLHDSAFAVGHLHYVAMAALLAFVGALHHWFPKLTGRLYSERHARLAALVTFIGLHLAFFTTLLMGADGMPRRHAEYDGAYQAYHLVAAVGATLLVVGLLWTLATLGRALIAGPPAPANPWGGVSLEWATQSPPITANFAQTPHVDAGPYDYPEIATATVRR